METKLADQKTNISINEDYLTPQELADILKVPLSWVYSRSRQKGKNTIPKIRAGRYLRFLRTEVVGWLEQRSQAE